MTIETLALQISGLLLSPLMLGVINKTKAVIGGRDGAPFIQPYFDLWRLLRKGAVYSTTTSWVFRAGPVMGLAAAVTAFLLTPVGGAAAPLAFTGDVILFAALFALMRFVTVAAALDTGSSFEGMGASREVSFSALAEPALFLGLTVLVLVGGRSSLTGLFERIGVGSWASATGPALALTVAAFSVVLLAENARIPVDDPNTHLELTMIHEVMVLDHSGPDLAYILYGASLKLAALSSVLVSLILPFHTGSALGDAAVYWGGILLVAVSIGIVESSMARLRLFNVPHLLIGAGVLGALGLSLALAVR